MADSESKECPCSNITIMQLFHELKQRYPKIPDHIVSKVIEQNFHDKSACETILQRESQYYLQSYPGALISGTARDHNESLSKQCSASRVPHLHRSISKNENAEATPQCSGSKHLLQKISAFRVKTILDNVSPYSEKICRNNCSTNEMNVCSDKLFYKLSHSDFSKRVNAPLSPVLYNNDFDNHEVPENQSLRNVTVNREDEQKESDYAESNSDQLLNSSSSSLGTYLGSFNEEEHKDHVDVSSEISAVISDRTSESGCDSGTKDNIIRSQSSLESSSPKEEREMEKRRWNAEDGGRKSALVSGIISSSEPPLAHNYQLAVECSMQPIPLDSRINPDQTRSFTSVNLYLRPPSSEPQPPIEIQSGQSLTYTTSSFNPKKGYQSQLQIRIDPELLEKQKERKDLLARELRREKEKLRCMRNEVRLMTAAIEQKPNPHILPKLKSEILRLRTECEKLTAAVDLYSDNQRNLPLGETDEEFYRNIYTGQRVQREGNWSCQLCTFRNHPLLSVCEECEMPRLSLGTAMKDVPSRFSNVFSNNNNTSFCTGAGTSASASLITAPLQEQ